MSQWVDNYQGVADDPDMIPTMGIRVLCGIGAGGEDQFYVSIDGDEGSPIVACFLLELAREKLKELALGRWQSADGGGGGGVQEQLRRRAEDVEVDVEKDQGQ